MAEAAEHVEQPLLHVELQKTCETEVEELARLVDSIKEWQSKRREQQAIVSHAQFANQDDFTRAQSYLQQIDKWIANLWQRISDSTTTKVQQAFANTLQWLHAQIGPLDEEICKWKYERRICLMGGPAENLNQNLANLKGWFDILEDLAISLQKLIGRYALIIDDLSKVYRQCEQFLLKCRQIVEECERRKREVKSYNTTLVQKGMLVFEEPPSVIRRSGNPNASRSQKHSRIPFNMEIRFLAGEKSGLLRENLEMEAVLISEQQARDVVQGKANPTNEKFAAVGSITYPICTLQAPSSASDWHMFAKFSNARLQKVEKAAEDDASRVMYHILFRTKMKRMADGTTTFYPFWAISLPFSVVINANRQERYKRALMFWQLAFAVDDRTSLSKQFAEDNEKSSQIPWPDFFSTLNLWFKNAPIEFEKHADTDSKKATRLQRGLEEHEQYIQEKIGLRQVADYLGNSVTWDMFYRRKSEATGLTFWEWMFGVAESISKFPYWESGLVMGFASRRRVEEILRTAAESSMILKFSDSRPGKMVASYINRNAQGVVIEHVMFDESDDPVFAGKTLVECIRMSAKLQCVRRILPSNKPIEDLYNLENSPLVKANQKNRSDGYVKPDVVFVWGEPPTPPVYEAEVRPPTRNDNFFDSGSNSPESYTPAAVLENSLLQDWLNTPSTGANGQFQPQQFYGDDSSPYPISLDGDADFGAVPFGETMTFGELQTPTQPQPHAFQNQQYADLNVQGMANLMNDDTVDPNFNMSDYLQLNNK